MLINLGPQHPSTHGVLRLILLLHVETILWILPETGLLKRGSEKIMEFNTFNADIPFFSRLDYVSTITQENLFTNAIERLFYLFISHYISNLRTLFLELSRILNHFLGITTHGIDLGVFNPMLWIFQEREQLLNFQESLSGSRMHTTWISISNLRMDLPLYFPSNFYDWIIYYPIKILEIHNLLTWNRLWVDRLKEIGIINYNMNLRVFWSY